MVHEVQNPEGHAEEHGKAGADTSELNVPADWQAVAFSVVASSYAANDEVEDEH